jgi:hypothetical protein
MKLGKTFLLVFLLFSLAPLISSPIVKAADPFTNTLTIVPKVDTLNVDTLKVGRSFKMSVYASNSDTLWKIWMKLNLKPTNVVRLDSISYSGSRLSADTIMDKRTNVKPDTVHDTIELEFYATQLQYRFPPDSGKILDLWFFGIKDSVFFSISIDSIQCIKFRRSPISSPSNPAFSSDSIWLSFYGDPSNPDSFWIKKGVLYDTIGINAKFPLPFTAYNDEALFGFQIPLLMVGENIPGYDSISFKNTKLNKQTVSRDVDTLGVDSILIKLQLTKDTVAVLDTGIQNNLFDLWLHAGTEAGRCSIYTDFIPGFGPLFFIDSVGGFIPSRSVFACTTFSYIRGDISKNDVVNNADLFLLEVYLFLSQQKTLSGELRYEPEDLNRIKSQRVFQSSPVSSGEWDSIFTFSQILFRGDVNGDSRVDLGDNYRLARKLQVGDSLRYGWSDPKRVNSCQNNFVRINFPRAYRGQKIPILIEIYNQYPLAGLTLPLQIPDPSKIVCDSITIARKFKQRFDFEWMTWAEDYDQDPTNQDLLITLSTLGTGDFPHIPKRNQADSAFILWCTVKKDILSDTAYINAVSLLPSHKISFFDTLTGYSCVPQLKKVFAHTEFADYGDAPDGPYFARYSFPTLYNTISSRVPGRRGPYHKDTTEWLGTLTDTHPITREWNAKVGIMDEDNLSDTLYLQVVKPPIPPLLYGWYKVPVTVTKDPNTLRYLNVLYDTSTSGNRKWENEWVVPNKLIIPTDTTQRIIIGPFHISQNPDTTRPAWARFTLTRDSIKAKEFGALGWDGSGPDTGWTYGETEDILFSTSEQQLDDKEIFLVELNSPSYLVGEDGAPVTVTVTNIGTDIDLLNLTHQVYACTGSGSTIEFKLVDSTENPSGFTLRLGGTATFKYSAKFTPPPDGRICNVQWKVSKTLEDGTKLVATDEAKFVESAKPYFVFLNTFDTTISYYGGVVDFSFRLVDPDSAYPITVTFERSSFEGDTVVYSPLFGGKDSISDKQASYKCYPGDILFFHWACDPTEIGSRKIILKAKDDRGDSAEAAFTVHVNTSLPDTDKVWVGRTGVVGPKGSSFRVPVEVYNKETLYAIKLPFKITGDIDNLLFLGWSFDNTTRCSTQYLTLRDTVPISHPVHTDTVVTKLFQHPEGGLQLASGFGKIFDLFFKGDDTTTFQIERLRPIWLFRNMSDSLNPDFESYKIWVVEGQVKHGDANGDTKINVSDAVYIVNYLFKGGPPPVPVLQAGDANCDSESKVTIADVVYLVNYLFKGGKPPC